MLPSHWMKVSVQPGASVVPATRAGLQRVTGRVTKDESSSMADD
jgi:hypothetical protein